LKGPSTPTSEAAILASWSGTPEIEAHWKTRTGQGVLERARVDDLLKADDRRSALRTARGIEHPWYRCQALTAVAEVCPAHPEARAWLVEALDAAYSQTEPNRVASVARWPLKSLLTIHPAVVAAHTRKLLDILSQEPHGLRRLDGLSAVLMGVVSDNELRETVFPVFLANARVSSGWRTERVVNLAIHILAPFDRKAAEALISSRSATRYTKSGRALLAFGQEPSNNSRHPLNLPATDPPPLPLRSSP
jgi:hypothetical protein